MKNRSSNQLPNNLPQLQNCIKRDPSSYEDEFKLQYGHYKALLDIFRVNPSAREKNFEDLVLFVAQVSQCYPQTLKEYPKELSSTLRLYSTVLHPETRMVLCKALVLLRGKSLVEPIEVYGLFFELLKCEDKHLREFIKNHIMSDLKNINAKHKDARLNTSLQNFMFSTLKDSDVTIVKTALEILVELYNKNVWRDAKTVNVVATCCFSKNPKILTPALLFFLGKDEEVAEDSDSEAEDGKVIQEVAMANKFNKKSRKRKRQLEDVKKAVKKTKKKEKAPSFNFSAIHLIYDPQGMAEKLLKSLDKLNERFEIKLMIINLVSRLIGIHELFLFNFYSLLQRFLQPHQREVTKLLVYAAQASHELVPPENLEPLLKTIANNFISERNSAECIAVGLNTVREMCARCPLVMSEDLLQDLAEYRSYKNKNVSMAAKSLIQLYRVLNPTLLKKRDRAKPTEATHESTVKQYGELAAKDYVAGTECLDVDRVSEDEANAEDSDEEEEDDGWINIDDGDDEVEIDSDSEPDEEKDSEAVVETYEDKMKKAALISATRILSQNELKKVKQTQISKQVRAALPRRFRKSEKIDVDEFETNEGGEIVKLSAIERLYKKSRPDKESRLSTVISGRQGREKFGSRKGRLNEFASKTEKERQKKKNFMMVKHKLKAKKKRSFREQHQALKNALLKKLKAKK